MPRDDRRDDRRGGRGDDDDRRGGRSSGGAGRKFEYRGRTSEDIARRAKQSSSRYDSYLTEDLPWFKPKDGENQIRLLPWLFKNDPDFEELDAKWGNHWGIDIVIHRNVGPDKGTYLCLDKMKGEPCPICAAWREEDIEALKTSDRVLAWLIDRNNEKAGPVLWSMPLGVSNDFSAASDLRGSKGSLLIDDPEEGHDLYFDKEGQKERTRYTRPEVDRDPSPVHDDEAKQNKWLGFVADHKLPDLLKFYDADYLEKILAGQVSKEDDDVGEERPARGRRGADDDRSSSRRGRSREDDPPDDDVPARPSRRGRAAAEDDPPDDDDAESEKPVRGGRSRAAAEEPPPSRRGRGRAAEPEPEEDPDEPGDDPVDEKPSRGRGGSTERYRGGDGKDKGEPASRASRTRGRGAVADDDDVPFDEGETVGDKDEDEVATARTRLRSVGRRSGR